MSIYARLATCGCGLAINAVGTGTTVQAVGWNEMQAFLTRWEVAFSSQVHRRNALTVAALHSWHRIDQANVSERTHADLVSVVVRAPVGNAWHGHIHWQRRSTLARASTLLDCRPRRWPRRWVVRVGLIARPARRRLGRLSATDAPVSTYNKPIFDANIARDSKYRYDRSKQEAWKQKATKNYLVGCAFEME